MAYVHPRGQLQLETGVKKAVEEERFLADCMLGRLAKWLRILGYDTLYQRTYPYGAVHDSTSLEGRRLLTRCRDTWKAHPGSVFIRSDHIGGQLSQLQEEGWIRANTERAFHRCPVCNGVLVHAGTESARDHVPEYVFYRHGPRFWKCPVCGKYYWHGTHRRRMRIQLEAWGLLGGKPDP